MNKAPGCDELHRRPGRPRCAPDLQRDAILCVARRLFVEQGFAATTTDDIAARCHVSKQTIYRLFPSKAALVAATVEAARRQWLALPVPEDLPLAEALARIFLIDLEEEQDRARVLFVRMALREEQSQPELAGLMRRHGPEVSEAELAEWLEAQVRRGRIRPGDCRRYARMLMDMVFGAMLARGFGEIDWLDRAERRTHILSCIALFLHGAATARETG